MKITVILPVSRLKYLDRVLESLLNQSYTANNLVVVFDGAEDYFSTVQDKVLGLGYESVVCVRSTNREVPYTTQERRTNISNIHNQMRSLVSGDWIFSIEDDGVLPRDALKNLVSTANTFSNPGLITGVELGRWGTPYVGAWNVDDIYTPSYIESVEDSFGPDIEQVDASGLYCALIRADLYKEHEFSALNGLGPDVNLGLFIRQKGYKNYINWGVGVTHLAYLEGQEVEIKPSDPTKIVKMQHIFGSIWERIY